jgi:hypothetical protein
VGRQCTLVIFSGSNQIAQGSTGREHNEANLQFCLSGLHNTTTGAQGSTGSHSNNTVLLNKPFKTVYFQAIFPKYLLKNPKKSNLVIC